MALVLAGIAVLAVIGLVLMAQLSPRCTDQSQGQKQPSAAHIRSESDVAKGDEQKNEEGAEKEEGQNYWKQFAAWVETNEKVISATGTAFIAAFTVVLAFATGFLYVATRDLVNGVDNTAKRQLRAYLGAMPPVFGEKFPNAIAVSIKNTGQTPATQIYGHLNWYWVPFGQGLPAEFAFPDFNADDIGSVPTLGAGLEATFDFPISLDQLTREQNKETDLFIYGHIDYTDVFGDRQYTDFCWQYLGERQGDAVLHRLKMHRNHNGAT